MGFYAYCVGAPSHPEPEDVHGLEDAPVRAEAAGGFSIWVSDHATPPAPSLDRIRIHNAVVEAACAVLTPLPFRFGQWFESREELVASIAEQEERLARGLDRVAGALEHGVRIIDPHHSPGPVERVTGKAYLESLAQRARMDQLAQSRGRDVAAALQEWLGPLVRQTAVRPAAGETLAVVAFLVDRHDTGEYGAKVRQFPRERPELQFVFHGPWPPYGFVD